MTRYLPVLALFFAAVPAQAVLTVRLDGNGLSDARIADGDVAGVVNPLTGDLAIGTDADPDAGEVAFDAASITGWTALGVGRFDVTANNVQTHPAASFAGGQINVTADYDATGDFGASVTVAVADQFEVRNQTIDFWRGSTSIIGGGTIFASNHYFNSSTPITPTDPFAFAGYGDVFNLVPGTPPTGPLTSAEGLRSFFLTPPVTLGIELQVANQFNVVVAGGDVGTVSSTTIVNPEPASVLLSSFGAVLFGFGYFRRRKSQAAEGA